MDKMMLGDLDLNGVRHHVEVRVIEPVEPEPFPTFWQHMKTGFVEFAPTLFFGMLMFILGLVAGSH